MPIGRLHQIASGERLAKTRTTCSGPYAIDDRASLDSIASACVFPSRPPSPSVKDLRGRPIKVYFSFVNIFFPFLKNFNKSYYTAMKKSRQEKMNDFKIFFPIRMRLVFLV